MKYLRSYQLLHIAVMFYFDEKPIEEIMAEHEISEDQAGNVILTMKNNLEIRRETDKSTALKPVMFGHKKEAYEENEMRYGFFRNDTFFLPPKYKYEDVIKER